MNKHGRVLQAALYSDSQATLLTLSLSIISYSVVNNFYIIWVIDCKDIHDNEGAGECALTGVSLYESERKPRLLEIGRRAH